MLACRWTLSTFLIVGGPSEGNVSFVCGCFRVAGLRFVFFRRMSSVVCSSIPDGASVSFRTCPSQAYYPARGRSNRHWSLQTMEMPVRPPRPPLGFLVHCVFHPRRSFFQATLTDRDISWRIACKAQKATSFGHRSALQLANREDPRLTSPLPCI